MNYMVMECHLSYAVVLDEEGRFLKVANRHYEVGQTVTDIVEMQIPESVAQKTNKWIYSLTAMAACLVLMVTSVFLMGQRTYASVYMTINPEVRIDVNRKDAVVGLDGINTDGDELIAGYEYKKKDLDLVMDELVDRAIDMDYLHEGGQISLVLDADSNEWVIAHSDALTTQLNEHLNEKLSVTIEVTDTKEQSNQVVIPVSPEESNYGESNYGEPNPTAAPPANSQPSESDYGESDYEESNYGESNYGEPNPTAAPPVSSQPSESDYGESGYDDGQSDYGESDYTEDSQTDYGEQSDYGTDDGQSEYDVGESDYSQSEYREDAPSDYGEDGSDYDDD